VTRASSVMTKKQRRNETLVVNVTQAGTPVSFLSFLLLLSLPDPASMYTSHGKTRENSRSSKKRETGPVISLTGAAGCSWTCDEKSNKMCSAADVDQRVESPSASLSDRVGAESSREWVRTK
jgi:hypothetical protein